LILANLTGLVLGVYIDFAFQSSLPALLQQYLWLESQQALRVGDVILFAFLLVLLAAFVIAWVGLWMLMRWARVVYTAVVIFDIVAALFYGPVVSSALAEAFYGVATLASGIILGVIWFSELSPHFEGSRV
jgi:hypothetical protein